MERPAYLPNFDNPPLNEVVLEVQFAPVPGYGVINAGEVWSLFRERFSEVSEQAPLPPVFETFGPPQRQQLNLEILRGAIHPRFWFVQADQAELLQFQPDRLIHNWRKFGAKEGRYPHFEPIIEDYQRELLALETYFQNRFGGKLNINQCEIGYINNIALEPHWSWSRPGEIFRFAQFEDRDDIADLNMGFRRVLKNGNGEPYGRLNVEVKSAVSNRDEKIFLAHLRMRGVPEAPTIAAAVRFMAAGRELIVNTFTDITTSAAHERWERVK